MGFSLAIALTHLISEPVGIHNPRITPAVELIEKVSPSIVPLFVEMENSWTAGTGVLISQYGHILIADHVVRNREGVAIFGLTRVPYQVVGRLPEMDLTL